MAKKAPNRYFARRDLCAYPCRVLTPEAAEKLILDAIPLFHREDCAISEAHGRVLRSDLRADRDLPPFDRVTMDGFALSSAASRAGVGRRFAWRRPRPRG
jgi:molybdopterin biosynthesis enzyme